MKVKILKEFRDKVNFSKVYKKGTFENFDDQRANYLASLGLVEKEVLDKTRKNEKNK